MTERHKRVRIKDVAEYAGVSTGTVDRVIHKRGKVSADVEKKVIEAIEELGFELNPVASALASNKSYNIAVLLPDYKEDPYWEQPYAGIEKAKKEVKNFPLKIKYYFFELMNPKDFRKQARKVIKDNPDSVLFSPLFLKEGKNFLDKCEALEIPCVLINTNIQSTKKLAYIGQDSYQSGELAARLLNFGMSKKSTVIIMNLTKGSTNAQHLIEKKQGFQNYFEQNIPKKVEVINLEFEDFNNPKKLKSFLRRTIKKYPNLSGIFFTNSRAYKAVDCLDEKVIEKINIIGFDLIESNINYLQENKINFLINQNPIEQGYLGIQCFHKYFIEKKEIDPINYLPLDIVVKENVQYYQKRGYLGVRLFNIEEKAV